MFTSNHFFFSSDSTPGIQRCAGTYSDYLADKARARASHERIHAAQQEDKRALRAHRRESETIGHYGTARHHGARTEIRASRKFYADRASSASTRRRRNDDRRLEALAAVEVRRPRSYRLRIDPPPVTLTRSEERRVGKECRSRWSPYH